jgi:hypothetical protein
VYIDVQSELLREQLVIGQIVESEFSIKLLHPFPTVVVAYEESKVKVLSANGDAT